MDPDVCEFCGCADFAPDQGFYYCTECGAQQKNRRETDFDIGAAGRLGAKMKKPSAGGKEGTHKKPAARERPPHQRADHRLLLERAQPGPDYPRWMHAVGARLCTATKVTAKLARAMGRQCGGAGRRCEDHAQRLLFTYFRRAGIAFCAEECAERGAEGAEQQKITLLLKRTVKELAKLKSDRRRKEREQRKREKEERMEQSSVWEQFTQGELDDRQEVDSFMQDETVASCIFRAKKEEPLSASSTPPVDLFQHVSTSLSVRAVNLASLFYLGIDLLICIVFLAVQMCGCHWILLSDMFRWYREGRFAISQTQLYALDMSTSWSEEKTDRALDRLFFVRQPNKEPYMGVEPTSESLRVLAFLAQFIGVPRSLPTMDFGKVLARLVYNLNLPRSFLRDQLAALCAFLPTPNVDYGADKWAMMLPVDPSLCDRLHWLARSLRGATATVGQTSFLLRAFLANPRQKMWTLPRGTGQNEENAFKGFHLFPLATEVKAAALILFAMKLFFGLDDKREHAIKPKQGPYECHSPSPASSQSPFHFDRWLVQLALRTHCWQGTQPGQVLSKGFSGDQLARSDPDSFVYDRSNTLRIQETMFGHYRARPFPGCVPSTLQNRAEHSLFQRILPDHFSLPCVPETDDEQSSSREALYAPLQNQALLAEWSELAKSPDLDRENARVFFTHFWDTNLDLQLEGADGQQEEAEGRLGRLFPCANSYSPILAPPRLPCFALASKEEKPRAPYHYKPLAYQHPSVPVAPVLVHRAIKMLFGCVQHQLSRSFRLLLRHLALTVAETEHALFFAFLLVQAMFFDRPSMNRIERDLRQLGRVGFNTEHLFQGFSLARNQNARAIQLRWTLHLEEGTQTTADRRAFLYRLSRTKRIVHGELTDEEEGDQLQKTPASVNRMRFRHPVPIIPELAHQQGKQSFGIASKSNFLIPSTKSNETDSEEEEEGDNEEDRDIGSGEEEEERMGEEGTEDGHSISSSSADESSSTTSSNPRQQEPEADKSSSEWEAPEREGEGDPLMLGKRRRVLKSQQRPVRLISLPAPVALSLCAFRYW